MSKLVYGVGLNDVKGGYKLPSYRRWTKMLERCYKKNNGALVCNEWLAFSRFNQWYNFKEKQLASVGYDIEQLVMDKDLLAIDGLVYSPQTCVFLPPAINTFLSNCQPKKSRDKAKEFGLPHGVCIDHTAKQKPYRIKTIGRSKQTIIYFSTPEDAYCYRLHLRCKELERLLLTYKKLLKQQCAYGKLAQLTHLENMMNYETLQRLCLEAQDI